MYEILAESVTGHGKNQFKKGDHVPAYRLIGDNIESLISSGAIKEIKEELDAE